MTATRLRPTVLLVDDHRPFLDSLVDWFESTFPELSVVPVEGALEGLEALATRAVDLVVTDLVMPGIDGFELISELRRTRPTLPVIVVTGMTSTGTTRRLEELGVRECLGKPVDLDALHSAVRAALRDGGRLPPGTGTAPPLVAALLAAQVIVGWICAASAAARKRRPRHRPRPLSREEGWTWPVPRA